MRTYFKFKSGANSYVALTEKEKYRILNKYKGRVQRIDFNTYEINDISSDMTNWLCDQFYGLIK